MTPETISKLKTNDHTHEKAPRSVPANELDLQMQMTEPGWQELSTDLRSKLMKIISKEEVDGKTVITYEELSGILALYTKDIRLGNLSTWNGEYEYVSYYLELAVDLLQSEFPMSCIVAMNKALAHLELSGSKSGFLRKLFNTIFSENVSKTMEPEKRRLMGGGKKRGEA